MVLIKTFQSVYASKFAATFLTDGLSFEKGR